MEISIERNVFTVEVMFSFLARIDTVLYKFVYIKEIQKLRRRRGFFSSDCFSIFMGGLFTGYCI